MVNGKRVIMVGSNNYLGLTHHPEVLKAAHEALDRYGTGCTGSRFLNGNLDLYDQLEHELAEFFGYERALEVVRRNQHRSAFEILEALWQSARDFSENTPQLDDITGIVIKAL